MVASNRLPIVLVPDGRGGWGTRSADGGLVTALDPVLRRRGGLWLGWPGAPGVGQAELGPVLPADLAYDLHALELAKEERELFYEGFSNEVVWPLFHGFVERCNPERRYWEAYRWVNRRFARALVQARTWDDLVWIHDYHLLLVGAELRALGVDGRLAFFLHIPFPPLEQLMTIPWHWNLIEALLQYDLIGFQMPRDRNNFLEAVRELRTGARRNGERAPPGTADTRIGAFPISIDVEEFHEASSHPDVVARAGGIRKSLNGRTLILGVDRLDYTKGIPEKLLGFRTALARFPELRGSVVLRQLVVPSRERIPAYAETKRVIEGLVASINEEWGDDEWTPVEYEYGRWDRAELVAHYRAADAALVTPLIDGMNLVAKEFCAANGGNGVLILSAFAGASVELGSGALLVDPAAPERVARAIHTAHTMPEEERRKRMDEVSEAVRRNHVHDWVRSFLEEGVRAGP